jgi:hypothetical protein
LQAKFAEEQEVSMNLADMMIEVYAAESALLRTEKLIGTRGEEACANQIDMTRIYLQDAADKLWVAGKNALSAFTEGKMYVGLASTLQKLTQTQPFNAKAARRRLADTLNKEGAYKF